MYINTLQGCSFSLLMRHFKMHIYIVKVSIHLPEKKSCMEAWSCQLLGSDCKSRKAEVFFISSCLCSLPPYFLSYTEASGTWSRAPHSAVSGSPVPTMMLSHKVSSPDVASLGEMPSAVSSAPQTEGESTA